MDDMQRDDLLVKLRSVTTRAKDVSSGNPVDSHLNVLGDAVVTLADVLRQTLEHT